MFVAVTIIKPRNELDWAGNSDQPLLSHAVDATDFATGARQKKKCPVESLHRDFGVFFPPWKIALLLNTYLSWVKHIYFTILSLFCFLGTTPVLAPHVWDNEQSKIWTSFPGIERGNVWLWGRRSNSRLRRPQIFSSAVLGRINVEKMMCFTFKCSHARVYVCMCCILCCLSSSSSGM